MKRTDLPADPDLLLSNCWAEVVPGLQRRRAEREYAPYTCLVTAGGGRMVREVVFRGGSTDEIPLQQSIKDLVSGEVRPGWAFTSGLAEYVGILWMEDRQFEALPWQPFLAWWLEVMREGPKWKREFGVRVLKKDDLQVETVMIPLRVAREAVESRLAFNLRDERQTALGVLERNWRFKSKEDDDDE